MVHKKTHISIWKALPLIGTCLLVLLALTRPVGAITSLPIPQPQGGSYGVEATKKQAPPTTGVTITTPGNGAAFSTANTTVNGICPTDLLVEVFDNGVMVGSVICKSGSFSVPISLFAGTNELTALDYDDLEQAGPAGNTVSVTYTDTHFSAFGALITLTSSYGRRSAPAGSILSWPLQLSGGTGPYAFSTDWGDGSKADLKSQALAGLVTISHTYKTAGIYQVNVRVTDVNGVSAFLQLIAVASGKVDSTTSSASGTSSGGATTTTKVLWIPAAVSMVLLPPAFWLGRRSQLVSIRNKLLRDQEKYKQA